MEQILKDQVKNKLTNDQITNLNNIMAEGTALNKNLDRENANEQIFLNNLIKEISGKKLLTFKTSRTIQSWNYLNLIGLGQINSCLRKQRNRRNIMK